MITDTNTNNMTTNTNTDADPNTDAPTVATMSKARYTTGNIWSWIIICVGFACFAMGLPITGILLLAGGVVLMPRSRKYGINCGPTMTRFIGYGLIAAGLVISSM